MQDNHLHLYAIELANDVVHLIDTSKFRGTFNVSFSPDGQWLAYTVVGENYLTRVRLHHFADGHSADLADNFVQTDDPVFGDSGLLYFTASIDAGPTRVTLDMSTQERPLRKAIFAAVLAADGQSPLAPKTADEEPKDAGKADQKARPPVNRRRPRTAAADKDSTDDQGAARRQERCG